LPAQNVEPEKDPPPDAPTEDTAKTPPHRTKKKHKPKIEEPLTTNEITEPIVSPDVDRREINEAEKPARRKKESPQTNAEEMQEISPPKQKRKKDKVKPNGIEIKEEEEIAPGAETPEDEDGKADRVSPESNDSFTSSSSSSDEIPITLPSKKKRVILDEIEAAKIRMKKGSASELELSPTDQSSGSSNSQFEPPSPRRSSSVRWTDEGGGSLSSIFIVPNYDRSAHPVKSGVKASLDSKLQKRVLLVGGCILLLIVVVLLVVVFVVIF